MPLGLGHSSSCAKLQPARRPKPLCRRSSGGVCRQRSSAWLAMLGFSFTTYRRQPAASTRLGGVRHDRGFRRSVHLDSQRDVRIGGHARTIRGSSGAARHISGHMSTCGFLGSTRKPNVTWMSALVTMTMTLRPGWRLSLVKSLVGTGDEHAALPP